MPELTGGEAIVRTLQAHGVSTVFGIPGVHNLAIYDALYASPGLRSVVARHEQGAGFMADGYARASGEVGVVLTITGPGATNALTAFAEAYADSSPVLLISSQLPTTALGAGRGYLHEMRDQLGVFQATTGWARRATSLDEIPALLTEAFQALRTSRPRPAYLEVPLDLLGARGEITIGGPLPVAPPPVDRAAVNRAANLLSVARRPVIYAGGGVIRAGATLELVALAEKLGAPVITSNQGKGAIPASHPLYVGCGWAREVRESDFLRQADLMLAVGTWFSRRATATWGEMPVPERLVHVDVDPGAIGLNHPAEVGIVADARDALAALARAVEGDYQERRRATSAAVSNFHRRVDTAISERSPLAAGMLRAIREVLPTSGILSNDTTFLSFWAGHYYAVSEPRTFLFPMEFGTLGFSLPAALGARAARPEAPVLAISGDGGFLFSCAELATAVQEGLAVTVLLVEDRAYGSVKEHQRRQSGARHIGVDLVNPDFVQLARAFGAHAVRIRHPDELAAALEAALAQPRPSLVAIEAELGFP